MESYHIGFPMTPEQKEEDKVSPTFTGYLTEAFSKQQSRKTVQSESAVSLDEKKAKMRVQSYIVSWDLRIKVLKRKMPIQ